MKKYFLKKEDFKDLKPVWGTIYREYEIIRVCRQIYGSLYNVIGHYIPVDSSLQLKDQKKREKAREGVDKRRKNHKKLVKMLAEYNIEEEIIKKNGREEKHFQAIETGQGLEKLVQEIVKEVKKQREKVSQYSPEK